MTETSHKTRRNDQYSQIFFSNQERDLYLIISSISVHFLTHVLSPLLLIPAWSILVNGCGGSTNVIRWPPGQGRKRSFFVLLRNLFFIRAPFPTLLHSLSHTSFPFSSRTLSYSFSRTFSYYSSYMSSLVPICTAFKVPNLRYHIPSGTALYNSYQGPCVFESKCFRVHKL